MAAERTQGAADGAGPVLRGDGQDGLARGIISTVNGPAAALGVKAGQSCRDALALILFLLVVPPLAFFATPLGALLSRRHEFQADAYACAQASGQDLAQALIKLYKDNSSTLTPDPMYVRFHYSHPPALERLAAMRALSHA